MKNSDLYKYILLKEKITLMHFLPVNGFEIHNLAQNSKIYKVSDISLPAEYSKGNEFILQAQVITTGVTTFTAISATLKQHQIFCKSAACSNFF